MVVFGGRDADDKFLRDMAVFIVGALSVDDSVHSHTASVMF